MSKKNHCLLKENDILNNRYKIIKEIGEGRFSKCWEAQDITNSLTVAIKVCRNTEEYAEIANEEIELTRSIPEHPNVSTLLDHFNHYQDSSVPHVCLVYNKMSCNLLYLIKHKYSSGMPHKLVKLIGTQIANGIEHIHKNSVIHCDIKPENILFKLDDTDPDNPVAQVKICDFGGSRWIKDYYKPYAEKLNITDLTNITTKKIKQALKKAEHKNKTYTIDELRTARDRLNIYIDNDTHSIGTKEYNAPEIILEQDYTTYIDYWSLGCTIFELLTGDYLFDPYSYVDDTDTEISDDISVSSVDSDIIEQITSGKEPEQNSDSDSESDSSDDDDSDDPENICVNQIQLYMMSIRLGQIPNYIIKRSKEDFSRNYFNRAGTLLHEYNSIKQGNIEEILVREYNIEKIYATQWAEYLNNLLEYDPVKRKNNLSILEN